MDILIHIEATCHIFEDITLALVLPDSWQLWFVIWDRSTLYVMKRGSIRSIRVIQNLEAHTKVILIIVHASSMHNCIVQVPCNPHPPPYPARTIFEEKLKIQEVAPEQNNRYISGRTYLASFAVEVCFSQTYTFTGYTGHLLPCTFPI